MIDQITALIVDESKWLTISMGLALVAVFILFTRHRGSPLPSRRRILAAMNLFFGVTIGTMAFGHLLAVTTKLAMTTLEGPVLLFYLIGVVLAVPSFWIVLHTRRVLAAESDHGRTTLGLNLWLVLTLLAFGIHNLPLAAPGLFNITYHLHTRRSVGIIIVGLAILVHVGLFVGSLIFFASGQSFEQFQGMG